MNADLFAPPDPAILRAMATDGRVLLDEMEHRYITPDGERWPGATEILRDRGRVDQMWFDEQAAARGTYVHRAVQFALVGTLDWSRLDPRLEPYVRAALKALRVLRGETIAVEETLASVKMRAGGRPDWRGYLLGRTRQGFIDWTTLKTPGARPNLIGKRYQMAIYRELILDMADIVVVDRYTVALYSDGSFNVWSHRELGDGIFVRSEIAEWWKEQQACQRS